MIKLITDYLKYCKAYKELNQLTDRELKDMGINRHDIKTILDPKYNNKELRAFYEEPEYALNKFTKSIS